jgi:acetolactate synthase small subunit
MIEKNNNHYKATATVQNKVGVLARMTVMLRKFNVNIHSMSIETVDEKEEFFNLYFVLDTSKNPDEFTIVMKKLERLVPVVKVEYSECAPT